MTGLAGLDEPEPAGLTRDRGRRVARVLLVVAGAATWLVGAGLLVTGAPAWPGLALLIGGFAVAMTGIVGLKGAAQAVALSLVEGGSPR